MPRYRYRATNNQGDEVVDFIEAISIADAAAQVEAIGLTLLSVAVEDTQPAVGSDGTLNLSPTGATHLSAALSAAAQRLFAERESIIEPLRAYTQESTRGRRRSELRQIADRLASDDQAALLSDVSKSPVVWGTMLAAAAAEGPIGLFQGFVERERPLAVLQRRRRFAALYPLVIVALCLTIFWPLANFVLPTFRDIFDDFGLELPGLTRLVLGVGESLQSGGVFAVLFIVSIFLLIAFAAGRWLPKYLGQLTIPFSRFWRGGASGMARLTTHTADLLEADLPLDDAVRLADEHVFGAADKDAAILASRLSSAPLRTAIASQPKRSLDYALAAPLEAQSRIHLLRELSACHRERTGSEASWASGAVGPFAIMAVGLLVGVIVLALYLPLISLIEGLS